MQSLHAYKAKKASKLHARGKSDSWNTVNLMKQCSSCWQETASAAVRSCCHKGCSGPSQRRAHGNPSPATQIWPTTHLNCLATYCVRPGHSIPALPTSCPQARKAQEGQTSKTIFALFSLQWRVFALTSASACRPCAKAIGLACCASLWHSSTHRSNVVALLHTASRAHVLIAAQSAHKVLPWTYSHNSVQIVCNKAQAISAPPPLGRQWTLRACRVLLL